MPLDTNSYCSCDVLIHRGRCYEASFQWGEGAVPAGLRKRTSGAARRILPEDGEG